MPAVTFDSKSLMIDGRRIWLVSGAIQFQRFPRETWADRIAAAKAAGLNTIETPVFWNAIEPRKGSFDFTGDNDIRHFLTLIQEAGMYAIVRPGPYIGSGWDMGGIPAWLLDKPDVQLRAPNQPFLESVGKFFTQLAKKIKDFQANTAGGGPIVLIQNESGWTCDHAQAATGYLGELARYLREAGITLPRINANNLWQGVEGEIDGWTGAGEMFSIMRQLATVRPDQPRVVIDFGPINRPAFGEEPAPKLEPKVYQRQLAEILASGGQFNISNFACGTSPGFWAGQRAKGEHTMLAPAQDLDTALDEHGRPTDSYHAIRKLACFTNSFSNVFANADNEVPPIVVDPAPAEGAVTGRILTQLRGTHGSVLFIFSPPKSKPASLPILMPDGSALRVPLGTQQVHWCLMDTHLTGRTNLDYSTLMPLFFVGKTLVVFGPAGAVGTVSINGTAVDLEVPKGRRPVTVEIDGVTVAVVSEDLANETHHHGDTVYIGVSTIRNGLPVPGSSKTHTEIDPEGKLSTTTTKLPGDAPGAKLPSVSIGAWECAADAANVDGSSPRYAQITGPETLHTLGATHGYGWYRVNLRAGATRKLKVGAPQMADRAQFFLDGEPIGTLGIGPGADKTMSLSLKKGTHTLSVLADNAGHAHAGTEMTAKKGMFGHLYEVEPFKMPKPKLVVSEPFNLLGWKTPLFGVREGDTTHPSRITWAFTHRKHSPLVLELPDLPCRAVMILNDEPYQLIDANHARTIVLTDPELRRGNNVLQLALHPEEGDGPEADARIEEAFAITSKAKFIEATHAATEKGDWSFAKWEQPAEVSFKDIPKTKLGDTNIPAWWRTYFNAPASRVALTLDLTGMTKGHVMLNGKPLGRYFVATGDNKKVPPQLTIPLPRPYLEETGNELVIFDEHGGNPSKVKVIVEKA